MATEALREIVGNLVGDMQFRKTFLENPASVISGFNITADEAARLKNISEDDILGLCEELDATIFGASYLAKYR